MEKKRVLTREDLLKRDDLKIVEVDLGDGTVVYVRQMTGHERDGFEQSMLRKKRDNKGNIIAVEQATEDFRAKLAVQTVCDSEGVLLFKRDDYLVLSTNISAAKLEKIIDVAQSINGIGEKDKEEIIKNYEAAQEGGFSSNSVLD
jgi:hypothetical protein